MKYQPPCFTAPSASSSSAPGEACVTPPLAPARASMATVRCGCMCSVQRVVTAMAASTDAWCVVSWDRGDCL